MNHKFYLLIFMLFFQTYLAFAEPALDKQSALKAANRYANATQIEHGEIQDDDILELESSWVAHQRFGYAGSLSDTVLVVDKKTGAVSKKKI